jgi:Glutamyl-tRNAGlu reductase, dimerisation domain
MALDLAFAVCGLQTVMDGIVQKELRRFQSRLRTLTPDQWQATQLSLRAIAIKFLDPVIRNLEQAAQQGDSQKIARICALFDLASSPIMQVREDESSSFVLDQPSLIETFSQSTGCRFG